MISFTLQCKAGHSFESWFKSADAFDSLLAGRHLSCPTCGSAEVSKALMAPAVRPARNAASASSPSGKAAGEAAGKTAVARASLSAPPTELQQALAALRREVEKNSEYVGLNFAAEARRIHEGDAPERSIYGEAKPEEARKLLEDGVPVAPLPFIPPRRTN